MPLCRFHIAGACRFGSKCRNSHEQSVCSFYAAGNCWKGQNCDFVHGMDSRGRESERISNKQQHAVHPPSGYRFDRVSSSHDNLSSKFRFIVPSPTPYEDQIFYSSDSDWDMEPKDRQSSCTLSLFTCKYCQERILGQEGEERLVCSECENRKEELEVLVEKTNTVHDVLDKKVKLKKKKRRKKNKSQYTLQPELYLEPDVYQTPEGVKVYRAKKELMKAGKSNFESSNQKDGQHIKGDNTSESCSEDDRKEPLLKKNEIEVQNCDSTNVDRVKSHKPQTNQLKTNKEDSHKDQRKSNVKPVPVPVISKPRNKAQRRRAKRQFHYSESPKSVQEENVDISLLSTDSLSKFFSICFEFASLSYSTCLDMMQASISHCLPVFVWLANLLVELACVSLAIIMFFLKVVLILCVSILYNLFFSPSKLFYPICYYLFHPKILGVPVKLLRFLHISNIYNPGKSTYSVPMMELSRFKVKKVKAVFKEPKTEDFFSNGLECTDEKDAEEYFSRALSIEPGNIKVLSSRGRARFNQNKLWLALEDLASLKNTNMEDLMLGAKCYFGLGMLNRAKDILKFMSTDMVESPDAVELNNMIDREEFIMDLPHHKQIEKLQVFLRQQSPSNLRYKIRLAEQMYDVDGLKKLAAYCKQFMEEKVGKGEHHAYYTYLTGLVEYYSGNFARAEEALLNCEYPCKVSRCFFKAHLANTARESLKHAEHCLRWGRTSEAEKLFQQAREVDSDNKRLAYMSRLGISKCLLAKGEFEASLVLCQDLLNSEMKEDFMIEVVTVKGEIFFNLSRYQDVIKLVLGVPNYVKNSKLVNLLERARKEFDIEKVKIDGDSLYE